MAKRIPTLARRNGGMNLKVDCCMHVINMHGDSIFCFDLCTKKTCRTWAFNCKQHPQIILDQKRLSKLSNRLIVTAKHIMNKWSVALPAQSANLQ